MPGTNPWKPVYLPLTREAFDTAAKKARIPIRDRDRVYEWATYLETKEGVWPSAAHAVHAWVTGQLARQTTKKAPPTPSG